jgi:F-type H+-transporting ATPase subunit epsilon
MIEHSMKLQFLSPNKTIYDGEVEAVTLPGTIGLFTVLDKHAPLLTTLTKGVVTFRISNSDTRMITISGGFAEVKENEITVCTEKVIDTEI